ncbi:MAG TPA: hypothetical protein VL689_02810 [Paraburkholderia sp.]|jgi:hypothetical protein|nr:hypothetical protein [Paraburkholderia sp.]
MFEFVKSAKMVELNYPYNRDAENPRPKTICPYLAIDLNTDLTDEQKAMDVAIALRNVGFDTSRYDFGSKKHFVSPGTLALNSFGLRLSIPYGTSLADKNTVGQVIDLQRLLADNHRSSMESGLITETTVVLPANGIQFTDAYLEVTVFEDTHRVTSNFSCQLDAVYPPDAH